MEENKSFLEIQKTIDKFINKHGGYWPPLSMFAALVEEIGELARELNHLEKHKTKKLGKPQVKCLGEELADAVFSIVCLANYYQINLNEELNKVLLKYKTRDSKRFI
jgi:NTP pyrophosphatase (non-canonical NTP hydrolase)